MSEYVAPLRYVNTPTVMEVWEQSQAQEPELPEKEEDDLSKEYDTKGDVTGTEAYYRFAIQEARMQPRSVAGMEDGFFETIGKGFQAFIDGIKKFFKWVFSFFGNNAAQVERAADKAVKAIDVKGVSDKPVNYPASYTRIWEGSGKPGNDISWVKTSLSKIDDVITKQLEPYLKEVQKYIDDVNSIHTKVKDGMLSNAKDELEKAEAEFVVASNKLFKDGPFIGGMVIDMSDKGKVVLRVNNRLPKAKKGVKVTFQPTASGNLAVLQAVRHSNGLSKAAIKKITDMEDNVVKGLNEAMKFSASLDVKDSVGAKLVSSNVKGVTGMAIANLRSVQDLVAKCIRAASDIGCAGVSTIAGLDDDDKK